MRAPSAGTPPLLEIQAASLERGSRELWADLDLTVNAGEFIAVLGPSGSGKTTLLQSILGMQELSSGSIRVGGNPVRPGIARKNQGAKIGYIPQQRPFAPGTAMRGREVVSLGLYGPRFGLPFPRRGDRERVDGLLHAVGATTFADRPVGQLSGGEQQRLRIGQALADHPSLLLCDEPLSNLDLAHQQGVTEIIHRQCHDRGAAVLFVTHDINPILGVVDRILYLAGGRFLLGTPEEVLQTEVLSDLYGAPVFVLRAGGRLVVVGIPDAEPHHDHDHAQEVGDL